MTQLAARDVVAQRLGQFPSRQFGVFPTPLHPLPRFSELVGREVWIKRDDLISVGVGGNKIRKLAYLVGEAIAMGCDHLITVGAEQSNHARCVASVAAMCGLTCDLVLGGSPDAPIVGNLLLDHLAGARISFPGSDDWAVLEAASEELADRLRSEGRNPYVMPIGGSTPVGALGFVGAHAELAVQLDAVGLAPSAIVHATSSGGTQAGLAVARALVGGGPRIVGVGVAKTSRVLADEVNALIVGCLEHLGLPVACQPETIVLEGYLGVAYAEPTELSLRAARELYRREGILVDPVYTAKALAAVLDNTAAELGEGPVVFWHTGGAPAAFAPKFAESMLGEARR